MTNNQIHKPIDESNWPTSLIELFDSQDPESPEMQALYDTICKIFLEEIKQIQNI